MRKNNRQPKQSRKKAQLGFLDIFARETASNGDDKSVALTDALPSKKRTTLSLLKIIYPLVLIISILNIYYTPSVQNTGTLFASGGYAATESELSAASVSGDLVASGTATCSDDLANDVSGNSSLSGEAVDRRFVHEQTCASGRHLTGDQYQVTLGGVAFSTIPGADYSLEQSNFLDELLSGLGSFEELAKAVVVINDTALFSVNAIGQVTSISDPASVAKQSSSSRFGYSIPVMTEPVSDFSFFGSNASTLSIMVSKDTANYHLSGTNDTVDLATGTNSGDNFRLDQRVGGIVMAIDANGYVQDLRWVQPGEFANSIETLLYGLIEPSKIAQAISSDSSFKVFMPDRPQSSSVNEHTCGLGNACAINFNYNTTGEIDEASVVLANSVKTNTDRLPEQLSSINELPMSSWLLLAFATLSLLGFLSVSTMPSRIKLAK